MSLKVLLVDEEFPSRQELRFVLEEIGNVEIAGECISGQGALDFLKDDDSIDAVFLDIALPGMNGLITAQKINELNNPPMIVFSTGFTEFAVKAFELNGRDYVLKPYSKERLEITVSRLTRENPPGMNKEIYNMYNYSMLPSKMAFWANDRLLLFEPEKEVFFCKSEDRKTLVYTNQTVIESTLLLKDLEDRLKARRFLRVHKSYVVNLNAIKEVLPWFNDTYVLKLEKYENEEIPVSRHFLREFKKALQM